MEQLQLLHNVVELLQRELGYNTVSAFQGKVLIQITNGDFELRLGNVLQQVYRTIEHRFPVRSDDLSIVIRGGESSYQNVFKLWRSIATGGE